MAVIREKAPAFQFYPKDFLASSKVRRMSMTERGMYITLLCSCWLDGSLPTDTAALASEVKMPVKKFERVWASGHLRECFSERAGRLYNDRLDEERTKQEEFRRRQSDNGRKGGRPNKEPTDNPPLPSGKPRTLQTEEEDPVLQKVEKGLDVAFEKFQATYPSHRRKGGFLVQQAFVAQVGKAGASRALFEALENHKASAEWLDKPNVIPGMDTWLEGEYWRQRKDPPKASGGFQPKQRMAAQ